MGWLNTLLSVAGRRRDVSLTPAQQLELSAWLDLPATDLARPHTQTRYVIVDVESSGLSMKKDRLIAIGAVALVAGRIDFKDSFQTVLRQEQVSSHDNILIHGIGGSAQSAGGEPGEALLSFLRYIGTAPLVAYHAFFDQAMIAKAMREYLGIRLEPIWIDLAWVLSELFPQRIGVQRPLDFWLQRFAIENIARHNAVSDAYATAKLLQIAIAHAVHKGVDSPADLLRIEKAGRWMHEIR
jgi:DNA polymerase-3 subunit epsilon